ncbi:hypothetical protein [Pseudonocardia sp. N23]|nr:hypothetical protein [Pseudonocardia sp. N23]
MTLHDLLTWSAVSVAVLLFAVMTMVPLLVDRDERAPVRLPSRR